MKKKILIAVVAVVVIVGGIVAYMAMTGGEVTEADNKQGESTAENVDAALDNADTDMPETDPSLDSLENSIELEEFDPAAEL